MSDAVYGLWPLVFLNTALFVVFAFSFFQPRTTRDWRVMGGYSAFLLEWLGSTTRTGPRRSCPPFDPSPESQ